MLINPTIFKINLSTVLDAAESKKLSKWELEKMKDDYEARLDKLICPNCRKPQSFDEFYEKKRNCSQCKMKYEKLNATSGISRYLIDSHNFHIFDVAAV
jgi:transcription initiation factor IIE alpha subunit